jgi:hypothetical protein
VFISLSFVFFSLFFHGSRRGFVLNKNSFESRVSADPRERAHTRIEISARKDDQMHAGTYAHGPTKKPEANLATISGRRLPTPIIYAIYL